MKASIKLAQLAENQYFLLHQYEKELKTVLKPSPLKGAQSSTY